MKLAEALILRADAQKRIAQLRERLMRSAKVQEGEQPPESPYELLAELQRVLDEFSSLVKRINRTNSQTPFAEGMTLTDALAERDTLSMQRGVLTAIIQSATQVDFRYGRSEIKSLPTVNVADLQKQVDDLARRYRELDSAVQKANWDVDLAK